jgi:ribonuclease HI
MLRKLTPANRFYLCHLFNVLYHHSYVPERWKQAILAPLLKPGKNAEDPVSYRPVALTSCVGKLFERVIASRLDWFVESKGIIHKSQAGFRRKRNTTDHIVQLELDVKEGFTQKESTVAVYLDISKAYDCVWIQGLMFKLASIGVTGRLLGWIKNFLTGRSLCVRVGSHLSEFRDVKTGVPQGAVISPLLFNIMLYDFPSFPSLVNKLLFADDITIYTRVKKPIQAESVLQPCLEKISLWGRRWKFRFSGEKSAAMVFTRAHHPGDDPLLFIAGQRLRTVPHFTLLGVTFDYKMRWHRHIASVTASCSRLKNLFSIIAKTRYGPSTKTLILLYKSLVQSKIDYGLIAYGMASKSCVERLNVVTRSILRLILGSRTSVPIEVLYAETGTTPVLQRRSWLTANYLLKLSNNAANSTYPSVQKLFHNPKEWPKFSTPCVVHDLLHLKRLKLNLFTTDPENRPMKVRPPFDTPLCDIRWFPLTKHQALSNRHLTRIHFRELEDSLPASTILAYTDGSLSNGRTACALFIPTLNVSQSWLLTKNSSVFSAELSGILQALKIVYNLEPSPEAVAILSDSKAAIQAITSSSSSSECCILEIQNLIRSLQSSGTKTILVWIPSHTGIMGNETADRLASAQCSSPTGNKLKNKLTVAEKLGIFRNDWMESWLHRLKFCQKPTVQIRTQLRRIDWHFSINRQASVCLHRLRSGHTYLNTFNHRIDKDADPSCRKGCEALETANHILLECPAFEAQRQKIRTFFTAENVTFDLNSILGLNTDIPKPVQFKIRNLIVQFLRCTGLQSII